MRIIRRGATHERRAFALALMAVTTVATAAACGSSGSKPAAQAAPTQPTATKAVGQDTHRSHSQVETASRFQVRTPNPRST
jgi:hypothetical protein